MAEYPVAVQEFLEALGALPALQNASSDIQSLDGISAEHLGLPGDIAQLPVGMLRRTLGGLPNEGLVSFHFELKQNAAGWRTLEFLAWFFRDQARGGELVQMRPFALPPRMGDDVQLGRTLRFDVDLFWPDASEDLEPIFKRIRRMTEVLLFSTKLYADELAGKG